ncbi:MAG: glycosyltransferase family 2 protein, partial [Planctomycetaceae bacterium]
MRNERQYVAKCLESVLAQVTNRPDCEILCIDGRSTDGTADIVRQFAQSDTRIELIDNPEQIVPTGMNRGIAQAKGDVIIRLDCHSSYAPDYIEKCLEVLHRTEADNVGGYMQTVPGKDTPVGRAIAVATSSKFGAGGSTFRTAGPERQADTVPFGCFRRDVFDCFGMYNVRLVRNQDIELNSRIRKGGGKIVISPEIKLTYYNRHTYSGLRQQAFYNGLWNPYTLYIVGGGLRLRHFVPMGFVTTIIALAVAGVWFWPAWIALAAVGALYAAAAGAVAIKEATRAKESI